MFLIVIVLLIFLLFRLSAPIGKSLHDDQDWAHEQKRFVPPNRASGGAPSLTHNRICFHLSRVIKLFTQSRILRSLPIRALWVPARRLIAISINVVLLSTGLAAERSDLSKATIVIRPGVLPPAEQTAARVLVEEIHKRTGLNWPVSTNWPGGGAVIAISSGNGNAGWTRTMPRREGVDFPENRPEGFRLLAKPVDAFPTVIWIRGADSRGALFGVGQLLRSVDWADGSVSVPSGLDIATAPVHPIRGHQLGYRAAANSYDGWDDKQYEQYIRELALFGANSIESIPFQDDRKAPLMPIPREVMDRKLSEICFRHEMQYWIWAPADFDLRDAAKRAAGLERQETFFRDCKRLDGVFFPGGDPGDNEPELVIPYLEDLSKLLARHHPRARIWLSMQGFEKPQVDKVHDWINEKMPSWLGGLVAGPSSPPIPQTRARLPERYGLRDYPDITHTVRCQFPVVWWDPAFNLTLGRECSNPRPVFYKLIQNYYGPYTSGSISYSDGAHDDVNKTVWSMLGWNPDLEGRDILVQYTRVFFGPTVAEAAADGILALEKNWDGPLAVNGSVDGTLALWQELERQAPELRANWRWQFCLLRAYFDAYTRHRLLHETELELEVNRLLAGAPANGSESAMTEAFAVLQKAVVEPVKKEWRARIGQLCEELFASIKLQSSVPLYGASGRERGAILDFVDYPLNNRWWLEDEFARIRNLPSEAEKLKQLEIICTWETPGPGSFYDELGNIAKSPRVIRGEGLNTDPTMEKNPNPGFWWWENGFSRRRLSWQTSMDWPLGITYHNLDPKATYRVRFTGYGHAKVRADGHLLSPTRQGKEVGEINELSVPPNLFEDGKLLITFDPLPEEAHLNWRQQSRVSEVWLLKD